MGHNRDRNLMTIRAVRRTGAAFWAIGLTLLIGTSANLSAGGVRQNREGVAPISMELCRDMKLHHVLNPGAVVGCDRLRLVNFGYIGFDGQLHNDGEIVVMDAVADHVLKIFVTLRNRRFPIEKAKLMNSYDGNDDASMVDNNTSAFNDRKVAGTTAISVHAYGLAIDVNPIQNPYVEHSRGILTFSPKAGARYADRKRTQSGMAETVVDVFADHGFATWGGHWRSADYQHFQVSRKMADQLARRSSAEAQTLFDRYVEAYRACRRTGRTLESCSWRDQL
jgi:D-alanyl-D-alanine carboxypeptidase